MVIAMHRVPRRDVLMLVAGALVAPRLRAAAALRPAREAVDHVVIGVSDLERGMAAIEERTGVRPAIGGSHPGRGTWNALFSLGRGQYAELIAPDPEQKETKDAYGLQAFAEPRLLMWAASTPDIDALALQLKAAGRSEVDVRAGSRVRPDGRRLGWRTLSTSTPDGLVPFFIQWDAGTMHPSSDSPAGCTLAALEFEAPDPPAVEKALAAAGLAATVQEADVSRLKLRLTTPRGEVAF
jgi:hypothetical protein